MDSKNDFIRIKQQLQDFYDNGDSDIVLDNEIENVEKTLQIVNILSLFKDTIKTALPIYYNKHWLSNLQYNLLENWIREDENDSRRTN